MLHQCHTDTRGYKWMAFQLHWEVKPLIGILEEYLVDSAMLSTSCHLQSTWTHLLSIRNIEHYSLLSLRLKNITCYVFATIIFCLFLDSPTSLNRASRRMNSDYSATLTISEFTEWPKTIAACVYLAALWGWLPNTLQAA